MLVDSAMLSPEVMQMLGMRLARESGSEDYLAQLQQITAGLTKQGAGSQGGEPRIANIKTETGQEQSEYARGERTRAE